MRKHFFFKIIFLTKAALPSLIILLILSMILIIVNTSTIRAKKLRQLPRIEYTIILNRSFADSGLDDVAKQFSNSPYWTEISREGAAKAPNHITFVNAHKDIITLYVGSYHGGYMP